MPQEDQKKRGRPTIHPDPEIAAKVREMAKCSDQEAIAAMLGFSVDTLQRHYKDECAEGRRFAIHSVKENLLAQALGTDSVPGSTNAQWKYLMLMGEVRNQVGLAGPNGGPVEYVDLSKLSDEELEEYGRLAAIASGLDPEGVLIH